jgi:L-ascorbate metabolism protein UlaG (beta-lactamase superfamily)
MAISLILRGVGALLKNAGLSSYAELDWDESVAATDARVYFLEAIHTSRRGIWDTNTTLWGSFLIESPGGNIYFAGDSAYGTHFRHVYERYDAPIHDLIAARRAHGVEETDFVAPHYGQVFRN